MNRHTNDDDIEALEYANKCLELLIPILSGPPNEYTEELLAAVAILRLNEEMDVYDNRFHLTGTTRILNTSSFLHSSSGLGEAAAWLCLRQEMYISLVSQQPLQTHLEHFEHMRSLHRSDDLAWANQMILLSAKILKHAFLERDSDVIARLQQLSGEVDRWRDTKPASFDPLRFVPPSFERRERFPVVWMVSPFHGELFSPHVSIRLFIHWSDVLMRGKVLGLQYYHLASLILAVSTANIHISGYQDLRDAKRTEKSVRTHLLIMVGLACSNRRAENALFLARHALTVWGSVFRDRLDQEAVEEFLRDVEARTGWRMVHAIDALREQWHEDRLRSTWGNAAV
ncbi:hypothetical protein N0V90_006451 [Kalmusia sp. IMI 367209]|nr:hypothetical protein N0V90_006451 [Kalmusia sp. IMI 367209]